MKLELILAADYANITGDGKLNVMGIFREINSYQFPARHPSMHLVIMLRAELGEFGGTRDLIVKLFDPDGKDLASLSGKIEIPGAIGGKKPEVNAILEFKDVVFPTPGPYQFVVMIDKDHKGELPIFVNQLKQPNK